ncbi:MAG: GIY-YIG nuclease family protein [Candidatus Uhrbacteria bacterium]
MFYVYILQNLFDSRYYYGFTAQTVEDRLKQHNKGDCSYTKKYRPWKLIWFAGFGSRFKAEEFERYLKRGSGYAFSRKRLI